ncbi:hypothetical protein BX070DRAFT_33474 [Coemansia spiralis]|nr:hypothetical protein BX070DRAFT_33474 [Coemansia spiralis]
MNTLLELFVYLFDCFTFMCCCPQTLIISLTHQLPCSSHRPLQLNIVALIILFVSSLGLHYNYFSPKAASCHHLLVSKNSNSVLHHTHFHYTTCCPNNYYVAILALCRFSTNERQLKFEWRRII